jgi:hypothetical protein
LRAIHCIVGAPTPPRAGDRQSVGMHKHAQTPTQTALTERSHFCLQTNETKQYIPLPIHRRAGHWPAASAFEPTFRAEIPETRQPWCRALARSSSVAAAIPSPALLAAAMMHAGRTRLVCAGTRPKICTKMHKRETQTPSKQCFHPRMESQRSRQTLTTGWHRLATCVHLEWGLETY